MGWQELERMTPEPRSRPASWKWWICGLLLCASAINYMDRQTLANAAVRITQQFQLSQEQYGNLELGFGWAFAVGSLVFGVLADRFPVRWVYPAALLLWSGMGFAAGLVQSYSGLLVCRTLLGFFEAGHWPCAVKTTQRLLEPADRSMGNSVLQSGTSIGAIIIPLIMRVLLTPEPGSWRTVFQIVGVMGLVWIAAWFVMIRKGEIEAHAAVATDTMQAAGIREVLFSRRMLVVLVVVALINTCWQLLRAWLPKFLQEGRGYAESDVLYFTSLFYVATDIGVLGAGVLTLWLHRCGTTVFKARCVGFLCCAVLAALSLAVAILPQGWLLLATLLFVGAGSLGVFGIYHAFTQDLSRHHQGKVTGIAGVAAWALSPAHKYFGRLVDNTGSFDLGIAVTGCLPLLALVCIWFFWRGKSDAMRQSRVSAGT
jgi:ACS family hexuronate transporter-like MFS transporter